MKMARRTLWLATGILTGAASSLYAEHKIRRTLDAASARLQPDALVTEMGRSARQAARNTGSRVRAAVATGRVEMRRREVELWSDLSASGAAGPSATGADPEEPDHGMPVSGQSSGTGVSASAEPSTPTTMRTALAHASRVRSRQRARRSPSTLGK
jgi:hypothetical protein